MRKWRKRENSQDVDGRTYAVLFYVDTSDAVFWRCVAKAKTAKALEKQRKTA